MPKNILAGVVLAIGAGLLVLIGSALELELQSTALLGGAMGAVVALVPDRTVWQRLVGFALGFIAAWIGYVVRAAVLPDTNPGRAAAVVLTVLLCVLVVAASQNRVPLWALLLGTGTFAGSYELTYAAAPPELLTTSVNTASTLLLTVAVGFLAACLVGAHDQQPEQPLHRAGAPDGPARPSALTDLMGADQ